MSSLTMVGASTELSILCTLSLTTTCTLVHAAGEQRVGNTGLIGVASGTTDRTGFDATSDERMFRLSSNK